MKRKEKKTENYKLNAIISCKVQLIILWGITNWACDLDCAFLAQGEI